MVHPNCMDQGCRGADRSRKDWQDHRLGGERREGKLYRMPSNKLKNHKFELLSSMPRVIQIGSQTNRNIPSWSLDD
jgi:hypothetical protein